MQLEDMSFLSINSLISMPVPGMVQLINNVMLSLIYVDIFMSDEWLPELIYRESYLTKDIEPLNSFFDDNGYSSKSFIKNVGSALVFLVIYFALFLILGLLRILGSFSAKSMNLFKKLKKKLFWGLSITLFLSQFPPLFTSALINCFDISFQNIQHIISTTLSFAVLFASFVIISGIIYKLHKTRLRKGFKRLAYRRGFKVLTEGQRLDNFFGVYWKLLILLRWIITMLIMTFLRHDFYL
jgi:hypothetical protein